MKLSSDKKRNKGNKEVKMKKKGKPEMDSQEDYLQKLRKEDPQFYKAVMRSGEVSVGSKNTDEDSFSDDEDTDTSGTNAYDEMEEGDESAMKDEFEEEEEEEEEESMQSEDEESEDQDSEEDESSEGVKDSGASLKLTTNLLEEWESDLRRNKNMVKVFRNICLALRGAISSIQPGTEEKKDDQSGSRKRKHKQKETDSKRGYEVKGSQMFNDVVKLCLREGGPTLQKLFECKTLSDRPKKNKKWVKLKSVLRHYLKDLVLLVQCVSEPSIIEVLLKKGVLLLIPFYLEFSDVAWFLCRHLCTLWCTSEEKIRVLAFIAISRLMRSFDDETKDKTLKMLYLSFVKNCRFTSSNTWSLINFMRVSLVELYCLDQALAYRHSFIYVRQLAFHLRNAMTVQKPERIQLVYNWQYIHCLHLWADLVGKAHPSPILKPMIYPLVQIANGTTQLMKTPRYFPLVLHICDILTELSEMTSTFIPILPYLLDLLSNPRLLNKPKKETTKAFQWACIIKLSTSQLEEVGFTDGMIDQLYNAFYKYLSLQSSSIGFPEIVFPTTVIISSFLKKCKVSAFCKSMKQLLDKIKENSDFIVERRKKVTFPFSDIKAVKDWEISCRQDDPPLLVFYEQLKKAKKSQDLSHSNGKVKSEESDPDDPFSLKNLRQKQKDYLGVDDFSDVDENTPKKKMKMKMDKVVQLNEETVEEPTETAENDYESDVLRELNLSDVDDGDDDDLDDDSDEELKNGGEGVGDMSSLLGGLSGKNKKTNRGSKQLKSADEAVDDSDSHGEEDSGSSKIGKKNKDAVDVSSCVKKTSVINGAIRDSACSKELKSAEFRVKGKGGTDSEESDEVEEEEAKEDEDEGEDCEDENEEEDGEEENEEEDSEEEEGEEASEEENEENDCEDEDDEDAEELEEECEEGKQEDGDKGEQEAADINAEDKKCGKGKEDSEEGEDDDLSDEDKESDDETSDEC